MPPTFARALALPDDLAGQGVALRGEREEDAAFLRLLFISTRWDDFALSGWNEPDKAAFLASQFDFQRLHYRSHYAESDFGIVERAGVAVGRLYLLRGEADIRIVDISLLPEARNRGWGGALLRAVIDEARAAGQSVSIHVDLFNPARSLYDRLGFRPIEDRGPYLMMKWEKETNPGVDSRGTKPLEKPSVASG